jgi:hypothetical protein
MAALALLGLPAFVGCGEEETTTTSTTSTAAEATGATGAAGTTGAAAIGEVRIADVQDCIEADGNDVQRNTGTVGESVGDLVVDSGTVGVVYVFEDAEAASAGEADVREYEDYDAYREREIEVVGNTVIGYENDASAELLRGCAAGTPAPADPPG